jgi:hypothetical protein
MWPPRFRGSLIDKTVSWTLHLGGPAENQLNDVM